MVCHQNFVRCAQRLAISPDRADHDADPSDHDGDLALLREVRPDASGGIAAVTAVSVFGVGVLGVGVLAVAERASG